MPDQLSFVFVAHINEHLLKLSEICSSETRVALFVNTTSCKAHVPLFWGQISENYRKPQFRDLHM